MSSIPDGAVTLIVVSLVMTALSLIFTGWRIVVRFRASPLMGLSDWLMILGAALNTAGIAIAVVGGFEGSGRLLADPYWNIDRMVRLNHLTYASQLLNVYAMYIVKLSICAYLLALNFSKRYRWVIWGTVAFVTIFNFILPATQHFGLCRPLAMRWDTRVKGQCWSQNVRISIAYTQAISNIITDLIYATAPIAYIYSVQLSRRVQWSVRVVFLASLICTTISAIKLYDFQRIQGKKEAYYEAISLSIWSICEVSVGIIVANLPPLRKFFDNLLMHILPASLRQHLYSGNSKSKSNISKGPSYALPTYRSQASRSTAKHEGMSGRGERLHSSTGDDESDKAILEDEERHVGKSNGILRTTHVVIDEEARDQYSRR